ncbi:Restriction of telomere capping protein 5 [Linnemannia gamsii]|uniref:Restriction of telomere capping protein 5 n=1 Tax=Linnemannia gamsii TaxID=64522 RepID=A0ABQ7K9R3_9FUNG|nr:Restriction of telomere capping protein 5 [Linnemannia gamsii]
MGAVQSLLGQDTTAQPDTINRRPPVEPLHLSWASSKLQRDMATKFSEIELLSLRQLLAQLKITQDKQDKISQPDSTVYPDSPDSFPSRETPHNLVLRDFIKPLALYCNKVDQSTLLDINPLKAIFESFAEATHKEHPISEPAAKTHHPSTADTENTLPLEGQGTLQKSRTMEDSLKDLTLQSNFEWSPDEDDSLEQGSQVKATDLVEVLVGLFWLIQRLLQDPSGKTSPHTEATKRSSRQRAAQIVENIIQYSRTSTHVNEPIDIEVETIDFGMFSRFTMRNAPYLFDVLSPYFYSIFLIGNTLNRTATPAATTVGNLVLPGTSPIPTLNTTSDILTPENIALISWFVPFKSASPSLTCLYNGSTHGFSMNQFEVHVCKYPAPTLLLLLVERQTTVTPTVARRQSISFGTSSTRQRNSISSNSPPYNSSWESNSHRSSFDKLAGRSPTTPISTGNPLNTIVDEPSAEVAPNAQGNDTETSPTKVTLRKAQKERMILGAFVTETWKVSKSGWGNDSFALFELSPSFEVFPAKKSSSAGSNAKGLPTSARSMPGGRATRASPAIGSGASSRANAAPSNPHYIHFLKNAGVGFGGKESESCMLYMDDNLRYGNYRQDFAGGNVYMSAGGARQSGFEVDFEIVECEVWGLGGPEAKARQQKDWDFEQREANRRATVHLRSKDGEQDIDRDLLEMAGVIDPDRGHRHARRQSAV